MSETFDIIIKNGTIYDGTGQRSFVSDIFIKNEIIVDIRKSNVNDKCLEQIDANGLIVTPGFVDIHTHYDGQVTWDNYISPSSSKFFRCACRVSNFQSVGCDEAFSSCEAGEVA